MCLFNKKRPNIFKRAYLATGRGIAYPFRKIYRFIFSSKIRMRKLEKQNTYLIYAVVLSFILNASLAGYNIYTSISKPKPTKEVSISSSER